MRLRIVLLGLGLGSALVAGARTASATENFPAAIAAHLQAPTPTPACTVCHASVSGGRGTVITPFGQAMRGRGLQAYDEPSLKTALDALAAERRDSDQDGTPDIDELKAGADPNAAAGDAIVPEYGCALRRARGAKHTWALVSIAVGLAVLRRGRGRVSPRPSDVARRPG